MPIGNGSTQKATCLDKTNPQQSGDSLYLYEEERSTTVSYWQLQKKIMTLQKLTDSQLYDCVANCCIIGAFKVENGYDYISIVGCFASPSIILSTEQRNNFSKLSPSCPSFYEGESPSG